MCAVLCPYCLANWLTVRNELTPCCTLVSSAERFCSVKTNDTVSGVFLGVWPKTRDPGSAAGSLPPDTGTSCAWVERGRAGRRHGAPRQADARRRSPLPPIPVRSISRNLNAAHDPCFQLPMLDIGISELRAAGLSTRPAARARATALRASDVRGICVSSRSGAGQMRVSWGTLPRQYPRVTTKREPPVGPSGDSARTEPPMAAANSATMARPNPEPRRRFGPRSAR